MKEMSIKDSLPSPVVLQLVLYLAFSLAFLLSSLALLLLASSNTIESPSSYTQVQPRQASRPSRALFLTLLDALPLLDALRNPVSSM